MNWVAFDYFVSFKSLLIVFKPFSSVNELDVGGFAAFFYSNLLLQLEYCSLWADFNFKSALSREF